MSEFFTAFLLVTGSVFIFIGALGILKFNETRIVSPAWIAFVDQMTVLMVLLMTLFLSGAMAIGFINLLNLIQPLLLQEQLGMTEGEGKLFQFEESGLGSDVSTRSWGNR